jgi:N-acetylmuramoyl-L-alanine amidase
MKKIIILTILLSAISFSQLPNLNGLKICIDPGHGGNNAANDRRIEPDPGNVFWESESNFQKALLLRPMLQARGATVILTRETNNYPTDVDPTLTERWQMANANNVNWFHSIHSNAGGGTYTCVLLKENIQTRQPAFPQAVDMSSYIYNNIRAKLRTSAAGGNIPGKSGVYLDYTFYGGTSGGYNLGVMSGLVMPGELSEGSFHDSFPETRRLLNNSYRKTEAYAILNGFVEYYKIPYDTLGMIIGSQKNGTTPLNNIVVRLLPNNKIYNGDAFNNGFYLFDSLTPGNYSVVYETPGYAQDTVRVVLAAVGRIAVTSPTDNATAVPRNTVITYNFIKQMDTAFVRSIFSINPSVQGTISWNAENTVMTFTPMNLLGYKTNYIITLAGLGNTLQPTVFVDNKTVTSNVAAKPLTLSFTTVPLPPSVQTTQPVKNDTNFSVIQNIGIRFSETMDTASVRAAFQISPATAGTFVWMSTSPPLNTLLWKSVTGSLQYETNYTVTIGNGAKSAANLFIDGNQDSLGGDQFVLKFRTQKQPSAVNDEKATPHIFSLGQNFPNPFNPITNIVFSIAEYGSASILIYDVLGRQIETVLNDKVTPGNYSVQWDASKYSSGIYFYKLSTEKFTSVKRMMLVK